MWRSVKSCMEFYMDFAEADVVKQALPLKKKKISEDCLMHENMADINMRLNKARCHMRTYET